MTYDLRPSIPAGSAAECAVGWRAIADRLRRARGRVVVIDAYPGVAQSDLERLADELRADLVIDVRRAMRPAAEIATLTASDVGDDPVFGYVTRLTLESFFDPELLARLRTEVSECTGRVVIVGTGAALVAHGDTLVYADLPRREATLRQRRGVATNLGLDNRTASSAERYKRGYFVDWRVADRHKRTLWDRMAFVLDTVVHGEPKLVPASTVFDALAAATRRPLRVVPTFDPAPWGGEWLQRTCAVGEDQPNLGWCFDCVPEENSLLLDYGGVAVELPAVDLVFREPTRLLGESVYGRFGAEFPIRTDYLDTMGGGNLSLQVHPLAGYIAEHFGLTYTQDESYYVVDAGPTSAVHLGVLDGVDRGAMHAELEHAAATREPFEHRRHVNVFPVRTHDHVLIPAGTLHGSAAGTVVLEISATPYIFTFKLYDWNRPDLGGGFRPLHVERGISNLQWGRDTSYARRHLLNQVSELGRGDGWVEERTGLHPAEPIETRRHWFSAPAPHAANGRFAVLTLVEGADAVVMSLDAGFDPFEVHYAETFVVPAEAGSYSIRPGPAAEGRCATIKAFIRTDACATIPEPVSDRVLDSEDGRC